MSRDLAKVLNYGRIYGGARPFAVQLIRQHSRHLSESELERKVAETYRTTKGSRRWQLNQRGEMAVKRLMEAQEEMEVRRGGAAGIGWAFGGWWGLGDELYVRSVM